LITFSDMQCHSNHTGKHPAAPSHKTKAQSLRIHAQVSVPSKSTAAGTSCILFQLSMRLLERSMQTLLPADKVTQFTQTIRQPDAYHECLSGPTE
jgi:hypothetical protein